MGRHILVALLLAQLEMLNTLRTQVRWDQELRLLLQPRTGFENTTGGLLERACLDRLSNQLDPVLLFAISQTAEGLAEGHVADDIEGSEVIPRAHVQLLSRSRKWLESLDE